MTAARINADKWVRNLAERRLNFFIAGVQKGGTTALHAKLQNHPDIHFPGEKELHFFDNERIDWDKPDYAKLHADFDFNQTGIFGEATPIYTYWPASIPRLYAYNNLAKIIVILRHPTFRAISAWKMERARYAEILSFGMAISTLGRLRVKFAKNGVHRVYSYVERGLYSAQVDRLLSTFPRDQILFLTTDQLWLEEHETLARVCKFLAVDDTFADTVASERKYIVPVDSSHIDLPKSRYIARLNSFFHDEIQQTAEMTGLDLSDWTQENYAEPMQAK